MTQRHNGFTLVELTLAMAVFSFVLILIVGGIMTILRMYESGLAMRSTQQNARAVMNQIVKEGHSAYNVSVVPGPSNPLGVASSEICLYLPGSMIQYYVDATHYYVHQVVQATGQTCNSLSSAATDGSAGQILSASDVATVLMNVPFNSPTPPQSLTLSLSMAPEPAAVNGGLQSDPVTGLPQCKPSSGGSNFCAITQMMTTVSLQGVAQ